MAKSRRPRDKTRATRLYQHGPAYRQGTLKVDGGHTIYFEELGNPEGKPALIIHGGPGGGMDQAHAGAFDPTTYRVVMFDQRGCGHSTPHGSLENNTTWDLVKDIERLREHLGVSSWLVCGGSWGSALTLIYAETHPERVDSMIVRSIFTCTSEEIAWAYQSGADAIFPAEWEQFLAPIPPEERGDLIAAYHARLTSDDAATRAAAARAWSFWEGSILSLYPDPERIAKFTNPTFAEALARLELHYFKNGCFIPDQFIYERIEHIRHKPAVIIQGRYDICTPARTAWRLHSVWPEADFVIVPDAGHVITEPGTVDAMVAATQRLLHVTP